MVEKDLSSVLPPDHLMYSDAVEAMKRYHQAQADGVNCTELERLRLLAEHSFQAVTDYQLHALGGPKKPSH
jgi:S-methylmethionine-dependent homocysteine/selenocysteine methylase